MNVKLDLYVIRARLFPALLVALPLGLAALAILPEVIESWAVIWSLIIFCGGAVLFAEIGRDFGKRKEPQLFSLWGGKPTTSLLRFANSGNNIVLLRRHRQLEQIIPGLTLPSPEEEMRDPAEADKKYESCIDYLRTLTRDKKKYPLIFEENCSYGFRRNLWGIKPLGIITTALGLVSVSGVAANRYFSGDIPVSPLEIICGVINLALLLFWSIWFTPSWVKIPADAYAQRLLESLDSIK